MLEKQECTIQCRTILNVSRRKENAVGITGNAFSIWALLQFALKKNNPAVQSLRCFATYESAAFLNKEHLYIHTTLVTLNTQLAYTYVRHPNSADTFKYSTTFTVLVRLHPNSCTGAELQASIVFCFA